MAEPYIITGLEGTGIHPRLEINDLRQNDIQFSLFVRAFNKILDKKTEYGELESYVQRPDSWWQLGGIHGLPNEPWAGDPDGPEEPASEQYGGYCFHGSALFPTWHRVQLLLIEQVIVKEAIDFASRLPDGLPEKKDWVKAANTLRLPFWDWTNPQTAKRGIPGIFRWPKVFIVNPTSSVDDEVSNPLNHYRFPDNHKALSTNPASIGVGLWSRTYRWVNFEYDPPKEDYKGARNALGKGGGPRGISNESVTSLRQKVAGLFNYPLDIDDKFKPNLWGHFSTTGSNNIYVPDVRYRSLPSIEDPHNKVHLDIGGYGTMAFNDFAGFDPIFYLHHANIDRIYAFWEWIYPDYWIGEGGWSDEDDSSKVFENGAEGNFSQKPRGPLKASTNLIPFRITADTYWTSEDVRSLLETSRTQKYYTYPAIRDEKTGVKIEPHIKQEGDREKFRQALYNQWGTDLVTDIRHVREALADQSWANGIKSLLLDEPEGDVSYLRNYVVTGEVPEFAFPGSYRLELYWRQDDTSPVHVIDDISVFGRIDPDQCPACVERRAAENHIYGHMHLEPLLIFELIKQGKPDGEFPDQQSALDWLDVQIKARLRLQLVKPNGEKIADTETADDDRREPLEADKIPLLTLHWHTVHFNKGDLSTQQTERAGSIDLGLESARQQGTLELGGVWKKA